MPNYAIDDNRAANNDAYAKYGEGLKPLKSVGRGARLKPLKKLFDDMGPIGGGIKFNAELPDALLGAIDGVVHLDDPNVQELLSRLDTKTPEDEAMAKRVVQLKNTQFTNAPYTELIVYDWLTQKGISFDYQVPLGGGRTTKFGQVLDFAVYGGGDVSAWPVQGDYWHERAEVKASDEMDKIQALASYIKGQRVKNYTPIWERRLYKNRNEVLSYALANVDMGP